MLVQVILMITKINNNITHDTANDQPNINRTHANDNNNNNNEVYYYY